MSTEDAMTSPQFGGWKQVTTVRASCFPNPIHYDKEDPGDEVTFLHNKILWPMNAKKRNHTKPITVVSLHKFIFGA